MSALKTTTQRYEQNSHMILCGIIQAFVSDPFQR